MGTHWRRTSFLAGAVGGALLVLLSCYAPAPQAMSRAHGGVVRATTAEQAAVVGALLEQVRPEVLDLLPDTRDEPVEVWVQERLAYYLWTPADDGIHGFHIHDSGRIHIRAGGRDSMSATLAHELVHAALGDSWETLPPVIEEGLADVVATTVSPGAAARIRAGRLADAGSALGGLSMRLVLGSAAPPIPDWPARIQLTTADDRGRVELTDLFAPDVAGLDALALGAEARPGLYGCAFLLVSRISERQGLAGLHHLTERAARKGFKSVPAEWLLDAAGLSLGRRDWRAAAAGLLTEEDVRALAEQHAERLADVMAAAGRARRPDLDGERFLDLYAPRWGPMHSGIEVDLADVGAVRAALAAIWPVTLPAT